MGRNRSGVLELAVLGLLHETPMHGYELRKRLNTVLGTFRALRYGSLYPCLKELAGAGLITAEQDEPEPPAPAGTARARAGRRSLKIVYRLTADGKERLAGPARPRRGPAAWEDDGFGVHFAFFGQTRADIRLRILEGRRSQARGTARGRPGGLSRAPGSGSTGTPSNCSGMAWNQSSGRSAG